ncbi:flagellar protein FliS [Acidithiobacillus thiooxidans]|nr:flagellar protein FliS [Acidithiobacillus thiooxidans]MDX5936075.1 flagellar protein FliS [Acidithiobacillus thiooxidans]
MKAKHMPFSDFLAQVVVEEASLSFSRDVPLSCSLRVGRSIMHHTLKQSARDQSLDSIQETDFSLMQLGLEGVVAYLTRIQNALEHRDYVAKRVAVERAEQLVQHLLLHLGAETQKAVILRLDRLYRYLLLKLARCNMFNDMEALYGCEPIIADLRLEWAIVQGERRDEDVRFSRLIDFDDMLTG